MTTNLAASNKSHLLSHRAWDWQVLLVSLLKVSQDCHQGFCLSLALTWRLWGKSTSRLIHFVDRVNFLLMVFTRSCRHQASDGSRILLTLSLLLLLFYLSDPSEKKFSMFQIPSDLVGAPRWYRIVCPRFRSIILITSAKFPWPDNKTYSEVPKIRARTSLGGLSIDYTWSCVCKICKSDIFWRLCRRSSILHFPVNLRAFLKLSFFNHCCFLYKMSFRNGNEHFLKDYGGTQLHRKYQRPWHTTTDISGNLVFIHTQAHAFTQTHTHTSVSELD